MHLPKNGRINLSLLGFYKNLLSYSILTCSTWRLTQLLTLSRQKEIPFRWLCKIRVTINPKLPRCLKLLVMILHCWVCVGSPKRRQSWPCAQGGSPKNRGRLFWLPFSLVLSFGQVEAGRKSRTAGQKKRTKSIMKLGHAMQKIGTVAAWNFEAGPGQETKKVEY